MERDKIMFLFKKKKIYKVIWSYWSSGINPYTDLVKAYDEEHAWRKIRNQHCTITLISVEEVK